MSHVTPTGQQAIPAPRGARNSATRIVASAVGVYGGLLGMEHGIGETLQGNVAPGGILINAIGPQAKDVWQGRERLLLPGFRRPCNRHLREQPEPCKHSRSFPDGASSVDDHCCIRARSPETVPSSQRRLSV